MDSSSAPGAKPAFGDWCRQNDVVKVDSGHMKLVNDSLFELSSPKDKPDMEIVFFHGFQPTKCDEAFYRTWMSEGEVLWPQEWLPSEFPSARVLAVSYDSCTKRTSTTGRQDLVSLGESLTGDIIRLAKVGQKNSVILVGHSVGGLVIKQLLLQAFMDCHSSNLTQEESQPLQKFLENVKGIVYFSTPHQGSKLAELADFMTRSWRSPMMGVMRELSTNGALLNEEFRQWRRDHSEVATHSLCETQQTTISGLMQCCLRSSSWRGIVVEEASARLDTDTFVSVPGADHFSIAKPTSPQSTSYESLSSFISQVTDVPVI